ncbi:MAG TPA: CPBP family intramembrane glutamic endopeptidase [Anaerolineales bacterium]|nr:CPBP family intramembrane glutamic endopeptidase [Anaerolineales bacterium]
MRKKLGPFLTVIVCVQILFFAILSLFFNLNSHIKYTYIAIIYLLIALLILLEKKNLHEFNLDRLSLIILVSSSVFRRRLGVANEFIFLLLISVAGLAVFIIALLNWANIPRTNSRWVIIGLFVACISLLPISLIESFQLPTNPNNSPGPYGMFWDTIRRAIYDLSFTAPIEEILFRGFVWGYLRKLNWDIHKVFLAQGVLFWLSHIGRIGSSLTFFFSIPILTYISSELTKRSGQVSPSIISHLIINTMVSVLLSISFG